MDDYIVACTAAKTPEDIYLAATQLYLDSERLHSYEDGNFRLFGRYVLEFLLMQHGEAFNPIRDPNKSDGQSSQQVTADLLAA